MQQCRISGLSINAQLSSTNNSYLDAVNIGGTGVTIDSHTVLQHGFYNLYCNNQGPGLQLKDAQFNKSWSNNVYLNACANSRLIGDIFNEAGLDGPSTGSTGPDQSGVYCNCEDLTIMGGVIEQAQGAGLELNSANMVSVTGMFIDSNGQNTADLTDYPGILIISSSSNPSHTISICGNHIHHNDAASAISPTSATAQIRFAGPSSGTGAANDVSLCGNVYRNYASSSTYPKYVYDVTGVPPTNVALYEQPIPQNIAVFSPNALAALLPQQQAPLGVPNNYLTGLTLSNDSGLPTVQVDITAGSTVDSTNNFPLPLPSGCTVNLGVTGVGGLDQTYSSLASVTLFYFLIGGPNVQTACIASESMSPSFSFVTQFSYYRMIGALFTDSSSHLVQFMQDGDNFYLDTSAQFTASLGSTTPAGTVHLTTVPNLISVEAFGRCSAGSPVLLMSGNTATPQTPNATYTTPPGYMFNNPTPATTFPFALYTAPTTTTSPAAPGGYLSGRASSAATTLTCYDDGWTWHRGK